MQAILRHKFLALLVCILVLVGVWYIGFASKPNQDSSGTPAPTSTPVTVTYKCPADYATDEAYQSDLRSFVIEYAKKNPNITQDELEAERDKLFTKHKCINRYFENKEDYPGWCPISDREVTGTLGYLRSLKVDEVLDIMKFLSDRECSVALQRINTLMTKEIESGKSPGSKL